MTTIADDKDTQLRVREGSKVKGRKKRKKKNMKITPNKGEERQHNEKKNSSMNLSERSDLLYSLTTRHPFFSHLQQ